MRFLKIFQSKRSRKKCLEEDEFHEIAELLESAMQITADQNFLARWNETEIQVQLMAKWRKPFGPSDEDFQRHLKVLTSALLSGDPRMRGYAVYRSAFK